jgi:lysozyme family protein
MPAHNDQRSALPDPFQAPEAQPHTKPLHEPVAAEPVAQAERTRSITPDAASVAAGALGMGELAAGPEKPATGAQDEVQQRETTTKAMEELKASKRVLKPGDKGPEILLLQQHLKQLGLHVEATGVYDKATQGYILALQTGGGLGADGKVGPKTIDQLLKLDVEPNKPPPATGDKPDAAGDKAGGDKIEEHVDHIPDDPKLAAVYLYNRMRVANAKEDLTPQQQKDLEKFVANWEENKARYEEVAKKAGVPAKLIAALHWRESTGDFGTYLHQGDPLGKKAVHVPSDIPIFKTWEPAAEHALGMKKGIATSYNIDEGTTDEAALASYAERYNGLGYFNKGVASPYAMSGTDQYKGGKYVKDGPKGWRPNVKDSQLGVLAMMRAIDKAESEQDEQDAPG